MEAAVTARPRSRPFGVAPAAATLASAVALAGAVAGFLALGPGGGARWLVGIGWVASCAALAVGVARWTVARQAARMRRDFAAGVSHDLRTPLAQIQMFTEMLLLGRDRSEEERTEWLEVIEREAHALGGLVDNLLLLAQAPGPRAFPARERLDLGELIEDVAATFASRAAAQGMRIAADPPPGVVVEVDPRAMAQTISNLLDNALRFGPEGQCVDVSVRSGGGLAELTVEDQGPGIPGEERARFLRPSGHLSRPLGSEGGRGLGLAVVAEVVRGHGGRAAVDELPGGGARVRVFLPLAAPARLPAAGG